MFRSFFIKPYPNLDDNNSFVTKTKELFIGFLVFFLFAGVCSGLLKIMDYFICERTGFSFYEAIVEQQTIGVNNLSVFFVIFLGPLLEELTFRLPLKVNKLNISIALSVLSIYFVGDKLIEISINSIYTWIKIIPITIVILLIYNFKTDYLFTKIEKHYTLYFYFLAISFGCIHLFNFYKVVPNNLLLFSPLFIISLILLGIFLNYIRLKLGILWAVFAHAFFNILVMFSSK